MFGIFDYISPKQMHNCPLCGNIHASYDAARGCIESHGVPESMIGYDGIGCYNCPDVVVIKLSDGRTAKYTITDVFFRGR